MSRVVISCFVSIQFRFWEAKKKKQQERRPFSFVGRRDSPTPPPTRLGRPVVPRFRTDPPFHGRFQCRLGFHRVLPGFTVFLLFFFVRAWKSLIVLNATAKKTDWNEWFCWFPIARLLKRINELALFTGAAIKSGPTGFYRVLPGFYWVFPGFFVRAWKSLMVLNVAAKKNRLEWMVLLAFVC